MRLLSTKPLTFLKELFRRFKICSSTSLRVPCSSKWIGPVKPSMLTCYREVFINTNEDHNNNNNNNNNLLLIVRLLHWEMLICALQRKITKSRET